MCGSNAISIKLSPQPNNNSEMRLLFVHERIGAFGGAEANILLAAEELRRRGHSVGMAHGSGAGRGEAEWRDVFAERFALSGSADALDRALAQFQPDVIFLHKLSDVRVLHSLATCGRPVVRMVHDHDLYCMRSYKYHYFSRRICTRAASAYCIFPCGASVARGTEAGFPLRWVSYSAKRREIDVNKKYHRLIVATAYMREELLRNGFALDQIEIHAPVPRAAESPDSPSFSGRNLIVYAGQIVRGKGVDVLLESLARVTAPFECVILGDGSQRAECERLSRRLGLDGRRWGVPVPWPSATQRGRRQRVQEAIEHRELIGKSPMSDDDALGIAGAARGAGERAGNRRGRGRMPGLRRRPGLGAAGPAYRARGLKYSLDSRRHSMITAPRPASHTRAAKISPMPTDGRRRSSSKNSVYTTNSTVPVIRA